MSKLRRVLLVCVIISICLLSAAMAQNAPAAGGAAAGRGAAARGGFGMTAADPRVQNRTYVLADTNETMPYSVFVSSKVSKDKKAPLVIMLHGLGVDNTFMIRGNVLDLAEEGGYIVAAPLGYTTGSWYGIASMAQAMSGMGRGAPGTRGTPGARGTAPQPQPQPQTGTAPVPGAQYGGRGATTGTRGAPTGMFSFSGSAGETAVTDPVKVAELGEKDVMNVLEIIRKEFNVDERRTYLAGHSMGGAGTLYLGVKYASNWAAIGAMAPAAFTLQPESLEKAKDMPVIIVQGDADTLVPVANTRRWVDKMKELKMTYEYKEVAGGDHGSVITTGMPDIFKFFAAHSKPEQKAVSEAAAKPGV